ncbi:MAG: hypothetical protein IT374_12070 [Polyangiaceae bacterium]|nr:hypothetical protein [Polyangiaceae bacterium]
MRSSAWLVASLLSWGVAACAEGMAATPDDDSQGSAGQAAGGAAGDAGSAGTSSGGAGTSSGGASAGTSSGGASAGTSSGGAGTSSGGAGTSSGGASAGTSSGGGGTSSGGGGTSSAGASGSAGAPCVCDNPPAAVCLPDGITRREFASPGTCSGGSSCTYPNSDSTCPFGCAGGACTTDPCTSVSCSSPPAPVCNGASVRTYSGPGTCGGSGACVYPFTDGAACQFGCTSGTCDVDPCAGVTCNAPPAPECSGSAVRTYAAMGTCDAGACKYGFTDGPACPFGCAGGACKADPCAGVSCAVPPPPSCVDASTLRTPSGVGTCQPATGTCQFTSSDQPCPGGCTGSTCKQCATAANCQANQWCDAGSCAACGPAACGNKACDCGETAASCASDCAPCPAGLVIGDWGAGADGWTYDGLWRQSGGAMVAGSANKYCNDYTQNLTSGADVDLSTCAAATLSFQVKLDDDLWTPRSDKSERLFVMCSGDGGANWTTLTPSPFPANQGPCITSYCNGGNTERSFPLTAQSITLPAACRTKQARFRFQAKGECAWRMENPGWTVDGVKVN